MAAVFVLLRNVNAADFACIKFLTSSKIIVLCACTVGCYLFLQNIFFYMSVFLDLQCYFGFPVKKIDSKVAASFGFHSNLVPLDLLGTSVMTVEKLIAVFRFSSAPSLK